jgi:serine/threonine protein kinase
VALPDGSRLGPYEILAPLGAGDTCEVYRARDTRLDRTVATKVLPAEVEADPHDFSSHADRRAPSPAKIIVNRTWLLKK